MPESVLVSAVRTPVGRAPKGALSTTRPDDLAAFAMIGALEKIPALDRAEVEDALNQRGSRDGISPAGLLCGRVCPSKFPASP